MNELNIAGALAKGIAYVARDHYKEKKRLERGSRSSYRAWSPPAPVLKYEVFKAMPTAIEQASGGGGLPFGARQLYYQIRPLIAGEVDNELQYSYFTPPLVTEYEERHGPIPGLYYDPRGNLVEPHTGVTVPLGTQAVSSYAIPDWTFNKTLYVEKEGFGPLFRAAKLAERYDMAIMGGKGYATRAAKDLLAAAESQKITVLALHDCDIDGYEIARTLAAATRTSRHSIDVLDIGLSVADVQALGLATERVVMRKQPSWEFQSRLSDEERKFFLTQSVRTELNAMSSQQLIDFVEAKLKELGLTEKVVPPEKAARVRFNVVAEDYLTLVAKQLVQKALKDTLGITLEGLEKQAKRKLRKGHRAPKGFYKSMQRELNDGRRPLSWRDYTLMKAVSSSRQRVKEKKADVLAALAATLQGGEANDGR